MKFKKLSLLIVVIVFLLLPFVGADFISLDELLDNAKEANYIFWNLRVPRVIFAFLIGGILTLSGLVFQSIFKNDLATPFTLGVASGASFGAVLSIHLNIVFSFYIFHARYVFAFLGALISVVLILSILKIKKDYSVSTILLAGIAINFLFSSLILFFQYIMNNAKLGSAVRWMMGNINIFEYKKVIMILPFYIIVFIIGYLYRHQLDILYLGDELAISKGVDVHNLRKKLFIFISIIIAAAVSLSGPIGFVGLIIPHLLKLAFGRNHKKLVFHSLFFGGVFLAITDTAARSIIYPAEMPVGIITAMLGVPFFLYLLIKR